MERFPTSFAATVYRIIQKQIVVKNASEEAKAAGREVARWVRTKNSLYKKAREAQREVQMLVPVALEQLQAEVAEAAKVNVDAFEAKVPLHSRALRREHTKLGPACSRDHISVTDAESYHPFPLPIPPGATTTRSSQTQ